MLCRVSLFEFRQLCELFSVSLTLYEGNKVTAVTLHYGIWLSKKQSAICAAQPNVLVFTANAKDDEFIFAKYSCFGKIVGLHPWAQLG